MDFSLPDEAAAAAGIDLMAETVRQLGERLAIDTDGTIRDSITLRLGRAWTLDELRGRLTCVTLRSSPGIETYSLDGRVLVRFFPPTTRREGGRVIVDRQYRLL